MKKKEIKRLSVLQVRDLNNRIEDLQDNIKGIRRSAEEAIWQWKRDIEHLQAQLEGKEPYQMRGGFVY